MKTTNQYRVEWLRKGWIIPKRKQYSNRFYALRFMKLLGPEPWIAFGREPDEYQCCSGQECGCGGKTVREATLENRAEMPPVEWIRLYVRPVTLGDWQEDSHYET